MRPFTNRFSLISKLWNNYCVKVGKSTEPNSVLTDKLGRYHDYLRISLTERCNLRCTYCMPEQGVDLQETSELLTNDELYRIIKVFASEGVTKVRLTGGEPTVRKDILEIVQQIQKIEGIKTIAMTTNGLVLAKKLPLLQASGLNAVNISLDTLDENKFTLISRRLGFKNVINSINTAIDLNINPIKVNCVIMRGVNDNEIVDFVKWAERSPIEVRFIEYMPFDGNSWSNTKFFPAKEMIKIIHEAGFPIVRQIDTYNATSKTYSAPGFKGGVGFITSMSDHFCSTCNRLRLMADGALKVCLFGQNEVSLRDIIRKGASDDELREIISIAVKNKKPKHAGMNNIDQMKSLNRPMVKIGG
jgi:molybdenum cofactor biosynthesis protein A